MNRKAQLKNRTLRINRETTRTLDAAELKTAVGGLTAYPIPSICNECVHVVKVPDEKP